MSEITKEEFDKLLAQLAVMHNKVSELLDSFQNNLQQLMIKGDVAETIPYLILRFAVEYDPGLKEHLIKRLREFLQSGFLRTDEPLDKACMHQIEAFILAIEPSQTTH